VYQTRHGNTDKMNYLPYE